MKRLLCLALCLCFGFMMASCKEDKKENEVQTETTTFAKVTTKAKVRKAALDGELSGALYDIGTAQATIENEHKDEVQLDSQGHEVYLDEWFDTYYTYLSLGKYTYIFESPRMSDGVSIIVSMGKAYGFEANVHRRDDIAYNLGTPDVIDVPANEDLFFLVAVPDEIVRYTYNFDSKRVDFLFDGDGALMATVLTETNIYSKFGHTRGGSQMFSEESQTEEQTNG
jgi:hypothetical protein